MSDETATQDGSVTGGSDPIEAAIEVMSMGSLIRGLTVHTGVDLGVIERVAEGPIAPDEVAKELEISPKNATRLLRALVGYGLLEERSDGRLSLTSIGACFTREHPDSLRDPVRYVYHPARLRALQYLPEIVRDGGATGYVREYGVGLFEYADRDHSFADAFNGTMSRLSYDATEFVLGELNADDFADQAIICDVGGGHGHLLCHILDEHSHLEGIVLDRPGVVDDIEQHWSHKLGVDDRCEFVAGDMFEAVPSADAYFMKSILHDWTDDDCVEILSTVSRAAPEGSTLYVIELLMPEETPNEQAVRLDMTMLGETGGRERTSTEFETLFELAGWEMERIRGAPGDRCIIEGVKA